MAIVPLDVQMMFVEWVYRLSQHGGIDYATLRVCALVCKAWTSTAQRLLLRRPFPLFTHFSDKVLHLLLLMRTLRDRTLLLIRTLRDRPSLATHILNMINIIIPNFEEKISVDPQLTLLELCPSVQRIEIHVHFTAYRQLEALVAQLRSVGLRPVVLDVGGNEEVIHNIIDMWPSVRVLHFARLWLGESHDVHWSGRDVSSVEALSVPLHDILTIPLDVDLPALRDVELTHCIWEDDSLRRWLFGTHMLSRIHTLRIAGPFPPHDVFKHIPCLESLAFDELPEPDANISLALPKTLRRVGYILTDLLYPFEHEIERIEPFVSALRVLPELQRVSATRLSSPHQLTMLREVCRERGVVFEVFEDASKVWRPQNVDWI
ncbi:hypothetical protein FA95DRAFT_584761 [Auriscalpium vulgare]|uniref:Uncharacterized protein n=1 Tax=Auriscalpium vulgare TaxID=40419 RepID=A0ACB8REM8_9AGAM|nr:hypothetical protein FA95DRAFT_584761 [Auriscalpium vulgare]